MMLAPSVPQVLSDFDAGDRKALGSFSVTVYILGFCVGPLLLAPLTDLYGRLLIYRGAALGFLAFTLACAVSPSIGALITFRFFAGCFGGAPMAIGGAVIADMYAPGDRDGPMAAYSVGTMMGPTIGPVLGGVITGLLGWRWVFWIAGILVGSVLSVDRSTCRWMATDYASVSKSVVANIGLFFILPETHLPTLEKRHVRHNVRNAAVKKPLKHQIIHLDTNVLAKTIARAVSLPSRLSLHLPVFLILLLICIFNGLINMILSSLGFVYQTRYHFLPTTSGLSYLGIGFGGITALAVTKLLKRYVSEVAGKKNLAEGPEGALIFLAMVPPVTTVGLLWYGWALQAMTHWIIPILGLFGFGFGYMCTRVCVPLVQ